MVMNNMRTFPISGRWVQPLVGVDVGVDVLGVGADIQGMLSLVLTFWKRALPNFEFSAYQTAS